MAPSRARGSLRAELDGVILGGRLDTIPYRKNQTTRVLTLGEGSLVPQTLRCFARPPPECTEERTGITKSKQISDLLHAHVRIS